MRAEDCRIPYRIVLGIIFGKGLVKNYRTEIVFGINLVILLCAMVCIGVRADDLRHLGGSGFGNRPSALSGAIRANRFARFALIGWFARIGKFEPFVRIGLTRYKNRGFDCEWFARIDSREWRCESPVPLSLCLRIHWANPGHGAEKLNYLYTQSCQVGAGVREGDATKHFSVKKRGFQWKGGRQFSELGVWW